MSLDLTKFACWSTAYDSFACATEEGIMPSEKALDDTLYGVVSNGQSIVLTLPIAPGTVIANDTKFFVSVRGMRNAGTNSGLALTLAVDGVSKGTGTFDLAFGPIAETRTTTITATGPVTVTATVTLTLAYDTADTRVYYYHDDLHVGMDSTTGANYVPRTAFAASNPVVAFGTHASPTSLYAMRFDLDCNVVGVYPTDILTAKGYSDTVAAVAHDPTLDSTTDPDVVSAVTTAFPAAGARTLSPFGFTGYALQGPNNSYVEMVIESGATEIGVVAWEVITPWRAPILLSLNGPDITHPVMWTSDALVFGWYDPNIGMTSDAAGWVVSLSEDGTSWAPLMVALEGAGLVPSGEQTWLAADIGVGDGEVWAWRIASDSEFAGAEYYIHSSAGWFELDFSDTSCQMTSPTGTKDTPGIITDLTPLLTWQLGDGTKVQGAYDVTIRNAAGEVVYTTGWVASDVQSHQVA